MFVDGSEVENCNVCNCYWFVDGVIIWLVGFGIKVVRFFLKLKLRVLGVGDVWIFFVFVCVLFCKELFKVEIILIKIIKFFLYIFRGISLF